MQQFILDAQDIFTGLTNQAMRKEFAPQIKLAAGLPAWFPRIDDYARSLDIEVEHHVISAGFTPLIEGTAIAPYLASIRSGTFLENERGIYKIKTIIDPHNKREEIIKICKGLGLYADLPIGQYHINYNQVIVLGDGHSDRRKFNFVRERGGIALGVYTANDEDSFNRAREELDGRVQVLVPRDYQERTPLEKEVKQGLQRIAQRSCDFDYRFIHAWRLGQLRNPHLIQVSASHWKSCEDCQLQGARTKAKFL